MSSIQEEVPPGSGLAVQPLPKYVARRVGSRVLAGSLLAALTVMGSATGYVQLEENTAVAVSEDQISGGGALSEVDHHRVAPGLELSTFSRLESQGWNEGTVLTADMSEPTLSMDVADGGTVTGSAPVSELMTTGPQGDNAVAAVNGTFFDINYSDAPTLTSVGQDGVRGGFPDPQPAITVTDGMAAIQQLAATGTATIDGETHHLDGINHPELQSDELGLYNQIWGESSLDRPLGAPNGLPEDIARATVVDGVVQDVSGLTDSAGDPALPEGGQVLVGRDDAAHVIADLEVGDEVEIEVSADPDVDVGMAGNEQILIDGEVPEMTGSNATTVHPRTAVGVSEDGSEMYIVVMNGRTSDSRGMDLHELGELFADIGAHNAVNLDGGGSSTMVARTAGAESPSVQNFPSDGGERNVPNALVFYSEASAEEVSDVQLTHAMDTATTTQAVFSGMQRTVEGRGLAVNGDPLLVDGQFAADGPAEVTTLSPSEATITGTEPGQATITYQSESHQDRTELRVLGDLVGLIPSESSLNLTDTTDQQAVTLTGFDADGRRAPIETEDIDVEVDGDFTVNTDSVGTWMISAGPDADAGTVTFRHADVATRVEVSVGTDEFRITDFSDLSQFHDGTARATGDFESTEGPEDADGVPQPAIGLNYDFAADTGTRGYYLNFTKPYKVDGQALSFELDILGDGTGVWPRLQVADAEGTISNLDGALVTHQGWETIRFTVPQGLPQPLEIQAIRMMETDPTASYHGETAVANMRSIVTPTVEADRAANVHDPAILSNGSVSDRAQHVAVISDAQFVAADPDSEAVDGARRTLREIQDAEPDLMIINGDFVDEAAPEDFELAQQILDEEWTTDIPYVYVPGNHEIMGGPIENFEEAFGETTTQQNLGRTEVITLNSTAGSLRASDYDQIAALENQLDAVAKNDERTGVVVFFHHPPTDPLPTGSSALTDQREARAVETLLAEFRDTTGKSAAVVNAGVGIFDGNAVEGVTYLLNGNAGKNPSGTPENGGFTGWTMLGVNPGAGLVGQDPEVNSRVDWLAAETRPWVDELTVEAPEILPQGEGDVVSATVTQDGTDVPVGWPVTAQWDGEGVVVDDGTQDDVRNDMGYAANPSLRVNPTTGTLTALSPGTATVSVTVNGQTATTEVTVPGEVEPTPTPTEPEPTTEPTDASTGPEPTASGPSGPEPSETASGSSSSPSSAPTTDPSATGPTQTPDTAAADSDSSETASGDLAVTGAARVGLIAAAVFLVAIGIVAMLRSRRHN